MEMQHISGEDSLKIMKYWILFCFRSAVARPTIKKKNLNFII